MNRNRWIQVIAMTGVAASMTGAAALMPSIDKVRRDSHPPDVKDQSVPPTVALSVAALGSFRGLVVDALWYRAHKLKEDGKFYEANQLSQWITTLQPRFPQVWVFHAWNMAYNISVATHTRDERWYWVRSGIRLLREKGIPLNPESPRLYKELARIFSHKVGQDFDDMHWYYKRKLAEEWHELLGAPGEGATTKETIDAMRRIHNAPGTLPALLDASPEVGPLWLYLSQLGYEADEHLLRQIGGILMYNYSPGRALWSRVGFRVPDQYDPALDRIFRDSNIAPGVEPLLAFLRKRVVEIEYRMDTGKMVEVMEEFGPLDWRHPAAHACYWAHLGVRAIQNRRTPGELDFINVFRERLHTIQAMAHRGAIGFDPQLERVDLLPDSRYIDIYEAALARAHEYMDEVNSDAGTRKSFEAGHENFMLKYITDAYLYGDIEGAGLIYGRLRELYGHKGHNEKRYLIPLHELVLEEFKDMKDITYTVLSFMQVMLYRAIDQGLGGNRPEWIDHGITEARKLRRIYQEDNKPVNPGVRDRLTLPDADDLFESIYIRYMIKPQRPITRRARVWENTPPDWQQRTYDRIYPPLARELAQSPFDLDKVLPQPPGMSEYRATRPREPDHVKKQDGVGTIERQ